MDEGTEEEILRRLKWENKALQQRVFELEEKIRKGLPSAAPAGQGKDTSVTKLLQSKDERLEKMLAEADRRNQALRLHQQVVDLDPAAAIAVNAEGRIVLINRAAAALLGEKIRGMLQRPVEDADFAAADPQTPQMVRTVLRSRQPTSRSLRVRDRKVETSVFPLGSDQEPAGALVKILSAPAT